jgi:hypothetical protein
MFTVTSTLRDVGDVTKSNEVGETELTVPNVPFVKETTPLFLLIDTEPPAETQSEYANNLAGWSAVLVPVTFVPLLENPDGTLTVTLIVWVVVTLTKLNDVGDTETVDEFPFVNDTIPFKLTETVPVQFAKLKLPSALNPKKSVNLSGVENPACNE